MTNREDRATWTNDMLRQHEEFAAWLLANAATAYNPPMPVIDTTATSPEQVAEQIAEYIRLRRSIHTAEERNA